MPASGLVSVIVVNFHTEKYLCECLASVRKQDYEKIELILVNNGSPAFRPQDYEQFSPQHLIHNQRNLGFAAANNQGIKASQGEFVLLLNADAKIPADFIGRGVAEFQRDKSIGTLVPQIRRWHNEHVVESTGHLLRRDFTAAHRDHLVRQLLAAQNAGRVFGGTAACVLYRRETLEAICFRGQYFDESFFAYFEDVDLDIRANLAGWKAWYQPRLVAYHVGGGSGERSRWRLRLIAEKNRYLSMVKNLTPADVLPNLHHLLAYELYHFLRILAAPYLFLAVGSYLKHLPAAISWRRHVQRNRQLTANEFRSMLSPRELRRTAPVMELPPEAEAARGAEDASEPTASVIILNYNGYQDTVCCLESLRQQDFQEYEVILVDNGSEPGEAERLHAEFPEARVIVSPRNLGFAGGVNLGAERAKGKYVVLLNNDAEAEPKFLGELVKGLEESGADAGCGALVSGGEEPTNDALNFLGYNIKGAMGGHAVSFYPSGGAAILRRTSLRKLGGGIFDPLYFIYSEDVSLGYRIRLAGGEVVKILSARVRHKGGATVSRLPRYVARYHQQRNRVLNLLSFYSGGTLWRLAPLIILDCMASHLRALLSLSELAAVLSADFFFTTHLVYLANRRLSYGRLRRERPLSGTARTPVKDVQLLRYFSAEVFPQASWCNRLVKAYLRLVGLPSCEDSGDTSL